MDTKYPFGFNLILRLCFATTFSVLFIFLRVNSDFTIQGTKNTVYALFMGPTILFTYLKIILLQYFQFSVSAIISSIKTDPYCICNHKTPRQSGSLSISMEVTFMTYHNNGVINTYL